MNTISYSVLRSGVYKGCTVNVFFKGPMCNILKETMAMKCNRKCKFLVK